jgi:hypothetical protein
MSAIFLSYRRDDSSGYAGRLFDNLSERFSRERVFMDIETLEPGMDFVAGIDHAIASCGAVIAMIGPNWTKAQDSEGRRRLDDPNDFIRLEITAALTRGVRVIPVLVHKASMPLEQELPEPLRPLCRLQACEISDNRWDFDVGRLADVLEPLITEPGNRPAAAASAAAAPAGVTVESAPPAQKPDGRPAGWLAMAAAVALAAVGGAWWFGQSPPGEKVPPPMEQPVGPPPDVTARAKAPVVTKDPASALRSDPAPATRDPIVEPPPRPSASPEAPLETQPAAEPQPVAAPVAPGPSPEELRAREIAELIRAAEIDLEQLRLTRPAGNNAFERLQRVLELEPGNTTARQGLIAITERYHRMVEQSLVRGDFDGAQRYLDSAQGVDPDAGWLTPLQREIDQRRPITAGSGHKPEPVPRLDRADRDACLSACKRRHETCRANIDPDTEADCLRNRAETCDQRYEACTSDASKMYMGQVSLESECIGVHINCSKSATQDCAAAPQIAEAHCQTELDNCIQRCNNTE